MDAHVIIAGQSLALGYLNNGPAPYVPTARVQIWALQEDGSYAWNYMRPGANTGTAANPDVWGPEVEIANRWLADNATGNLWLVKVAKGSTGLAEDAGALDWSPSSHGEMYDAATATINAAHDNLNGSQYAFEAWDAAMWSQGQTDATDAVKAAAYAPNFANLLTHARFDWNVQDFVAARINDSPALAHNFAVRVAQWDVDQADPHLETFKTIGFGTLPDTIHANAAGNISMGDGFYNGWVL